MKSHRISSRSEWNNFSSVLSRENGRLKYRPSFPTNFLHNCCLLRCTFLVAHVYSKTLIIYTGTLYISKQWSSIFILFAASWVVSYYELPHLPLRSALTWYREFNNHHYVIGSVVGNFHCNNYVLNSFIQLQLIQKKYKFFSLSVDFMSLKLRLYNVFKCLYLKPICRRPGL